MNEVIAMGIMEHMDKSRARTVSFICGILAIILAFNAYSDITSGAMTHNTVTIVTGYVKISVAVALAIAFTLYSAKAAK
jgi:hypothetical protein